MCLGCSISFGTGLPYENTWPYLVSRKLNLSCWNLSQPASSLDTCYRLANHWVPILKPKYIFQYIIGSGKEGIDFEPLIDYNVFN